MNYNIGEKVYVEMGARKFEGTITRVDPKMGGVGIITVQPKKGDGKYEMMVPFTANIKKLE